MKVVYQKILYGGVREKKEIELPLDARIFQGSKLLKEYIIESPCNNSTHDIQFYEIGQKWYAFINKVEFLDGILNIRPIEEIESPKDAYIVFRKEQKISCEQLAQFFPHGLDMGKLRNLCYQTISVAKIRKFTSRGIETTTINIKGIDMNDIVSVSIHTYDYSRGWDLPTKYAGYFFSSDRKWKKLFNDKLKEYYKMFKM